MQQHNAAQDGVDVRGLRIRRRVMKIENIDITVPGDLVNNAG